MIEYGRSYLIAAAIITSSIDIYATATSILTIIYIVATTHIVVRVEWAVLGNQLPCLVHGPTNFSIGRYITLPPDMLPQILQLILANGFDQKICCSFGQTLVYNVHAIML
jgi:hypothetical protein